MEEKWITVKVARKSGSTVQFQIWDSYAIAFKHIADEARSDAKNEYDFIAFKASATNYKLISKKDSR